MYTELIPALSHSILLTFWLILCRPYILFTAQWYRHTWL